MYEIDSIDAADYVQITVDSDIFKTYGRLYSTTAMANICGGSTARYTDVPNNRLFIKTPHILPSLTIRFTMINNEPSENESWGFKDIRVLFVSTTSTITSTMCTISPAPVGASAACLCPEGYYDSSGLGTGPCQKCDPACASCFGSTTDTCYQCASGYGFDGTQCVLCDSSCSVCRGTAANQCNACPTGKILFNTQTCVDSSICTSPLTIKTDTCGSDYCVNPCLGRYLMMDGSCRDTCESPLRKYTNPTATFCLVPCDDPLQYYHVNNGKCSYECETWVSKPENLYMACMPPPYSISRLLHYVRYLDIEMPPRMQNLTLKRENNILSLRVAPKMFTKVKQGFAKSPGYFSINPYLSTSFVVNFADDLILLGIILTLSFMFLLLEIFFKICHCPQPVYIFERIRVLTMWNLPIMLLLVNTGDIVFFAMLEFRSYDSDMSKSGFSLTLGILMFILVIVLLLASIAFSCVAYSVKSKGSQNALSKKYVRFANRWQTVQVLFRGFKGTNCFYQAFYPLYCFRMALPMIFSAGFYSDPLAQIILNLCLNAILILYLACVRPLKVKSDLVYLILLELTLLLVNISCLVLTILHLNKEVAHGARVIFGDIILGCEIAIHVLSVSFLCIKLGLTAREAYKEKMNKTGNEKTVWLQLLFIPLQQGCFGFEQVQIDRFSGVEVKAKEKVFDTQPIIQVQKLSNKVADSSRMRRTSATMNLSMRDSLTDFSGGSGAFPIQKISKKAIADRMNNTLMTEQPLNLNTSMGQNHSQFSRQSHREAQQRRTQRSIRSGQFNIGLHDTFNQTQASLFDQPSALRSERIGFL